MNNYQILIVAFILGQIGYAAVSVYLIQMKLENTDYLKAVQIYFKKEIGGLVMAAAGWALIMFVASDFIDPKITRADLYGKETLTLKEKIVMYHRTIASILGMFVQHILFTVFKKGRKAIRDYDTQNKLDENT